FFAERALDGGNRQRHGFEYRRSTIGSPAYRTRTMRIPTVVVLLAALAQAAPQAPKTPQPPVTFKVEVNYVEIDASVTDAQGTFVRNLGRDDFQVVEDGKPQ